MVLNYYTYGPAQGPSNKMIVTKRVWQFLAAAAFVVMTTLVKHYPFDLPAGLWLGGNIFFIVFLLAYMREERRATRSPDSNLVLNWNLIEAFLFLASIVGFIILAVVHQLNEIFFYAYFHTGAIGLLIGVALGEFIWQNTRLKQLDEECHSRYWENYKDSIW